MACSPDGSQSVWKRTLSAAMAVVVTANEPAVAAIKANIRIASFIGFSCARRGSGEQRLYQTEAIIESEAADRRQRLSVEVRCDDPSARAVARPPQCAKLLRHEVQAAVAQDTFTIEDTTVVTVDRDDTVHHNAA